MGERKWMVFLWLKKLDTSRGFQRYHKITLATTVLLSYFTRDLTPAKCYRERWSDLGPRFLQGANSWRKAWAVCFVLQQFTVLSGTPRWSILDCVAVFSVCYGTGYKSDRHHQNATSILFKWKSLNMSVLFFKNNKMRELCSQLLGTPAESGLSPWNTCEFNPQIKKHRVEIHFHKDIPLTKTGELSGFFSHSKLQRQKYGANSGLEKMWDLYFIVCICMYWQIHYTVWKVGLRSKQICTFPVFSSLRTQLSHRV